MACGPDSPFGTLDPPPDSIEFPTGNSAYCSNFRIGDDPAGTQKRASFPLKECIALLSPIEKLLKGRFQEERQARGQIAAAVSSFQIEVTFLLWNLFVRCSRLDPLSRRK
jgi:hypothetical protein